MLIVLTGRTDSSSPSSFIADFEATFLILFAFSSIFRCYPGILILLIASFIALCILNRISANIGNDGSYTSKDVDGSCMEGCDVKLDIIIKLKSPIGSYHDKNECLYRMKQ